MKRVIFDRMNFPRFESNKTTLKMKKLIVVLCIGSMFSATAQEAEIQKAQENLKAGKSKEAIRYLREAQNSIVGTIVGQMTEALPAAVGEFKLESLGEGMGGRSLQVNRQYRKAQLESKTEEGNAENTGDGDGMMDGDGMGSMENEGLDIYISDNLSEGSNVFMMHSLSEEGGMSQGEAIMVGKYKAVLNDSEGWKTLEVVTSSAFIRINGQGLKDKKPMLDLANAVDFEKLNTSLGN